MKTSDFAALVKSKYPIYKGMDDAALVQKVVEKHPAYARHIDAEPQLPAPLISAPGPVEQYFAALLGPNPQRRAAQIQLAAADPLGALRSALPVSQWRQMDAWRQEIKAANPDMTDEELVPVMEARAARLLRGEAQTR